MTDNRYTRCPGCATVFRVTGAQLQLRQGQVRCGHCRAVFDANDHFVSLDAGPPSDEIETMDELAMGRPTVTLRSAEALHPLPRPAVEMRSADAMHPLTRLIEASPEQGFVDVEQPPAATPAVLEPAQAETVDEEIRAHEAAAEARAGEAAGERVASEGRRDEAAEERPAERAAEERPAAEATAVEQPATAGTSVAEAAGSGTTDAAGLDEAPAGGATRGDAQESVGAARPAHVEWKPWNRRADVRNLPKRAYVAAIAVLGLMLMGQLAFAYRSALAAHIPATRPLLGTMCGALGCSIDPLRDSGALSIDASDLQADPAHRGLLLLTATIRNRAGYAIAYPYLELTLTDASDGVVVRRAIPPADYLGNLDAAAGLPPNGERLVRLFIDASATQQAGYRLYLFYP